jgi:hypothetical protein
MRLRRNTDTTVALLQEYRNADTMCVFPHMYVCVCCVCVCVLREQVASRLP